MNTTALEKIALSVRALSMDAIQKANSGHPGLPLGAAEVGAYLYGVALKQDPSALYWPDRDRFILSAGHGSMFLYSLLYLAGYPDITLEDIKNFRQIGSPTAGHPEYGLLSGIEATTGPLGQGIAMAVGMAIAETMLAARFNTDAHRIVDHHTYVLAGDGCLQEGVASEASSLAGHLGLGKLIVFYDSNRITIDGSTDLSFTEDVGMRYEAYGWQVLHGSMYDFDDIAKLHAAAMAEGEKPSLIILDSIIGKGSPNRQNTADAHGSPLGAEEIAATRAALGIPRDFYVAPEATEYFAERQREWKREREAWEEAFQLWSQENPEKRKEWNWFFSANTEIGDALVFPEGEKIATRAAGGKALAALADANPNLVGGSADLKSPNAVSIPGAAAYSRKDRGGRYLHFGIREFGMAAVCNGIQLHGGLRAFCATFLVFSDYLRPALRLSALMGQPVIYVFTHDSIYVGEDGPTHQPVEHLASLRAIPNVRVLRPADPAETVEAWAMALERLEGPTILALTRQNLPNLAKDDSNWKRNLHSGAYIVKRAENPDAVVIATGSEVSLAVEAAAMVPGKKVQIVSMISRELFESQPQALQDSVVPQGVRHIVCEAGVSSGWERWALPGDILSVERFGESGPANQVAEELGFTAAALAKLLDKQ